MQQSSVPVTRQAATGVTPDPRRWWALAVLAAAQFMIILDATIVNVSLAAIQRDLAFSPANLTWVINAYVLVFGSLLLLGGRLGDRLGRRAVFTAGLGVFSVASLVCGLAESEGVLIGARAVQGLGAALIAPTALALILTTFQDARERGIALGAWGGVAGVAGAAGALLGGFLTEQVGWEWIFLINVPFAVAAAAVGFLVVRESRESHSPGRGGFDLPGAVLVTTGLAALVYGIVGAEEHGWLAGRTLSLGVAAAILLVVFVLVERRTAQPLIAFGLFRHRSLSVANVLGLLTGGAILTSMFYFASLYLQVILGMSAQEAGLAFLPLSIVAIVSAGSTSSLIGRFGVRPVIFAGCALLAGALLWFSAVDATGSFTSDFLGPSLLAALGLGPIVVGVTVAATAEVPVQQVGLASGVINAAQQVGGALGLAVLSTVASERSSDGLAAAGGSPQAIANALTAGYGAAFVGAAVIMIVCAAIALVLLPRSTAMPPVPSVVPATD